MARTILARSQGLRSLARSTGDVIHTETINTQTKKGSGNFCKLPSKQVAATPNHQTGRFRASWARTIAMVVKKASPASRRPRLASLENNGHEARTATLRGRSHGRLGSTRKTNQPRATMVRPP